MESEGARANSFIMEESITLRELADSCAKPSHRLFTIGGVEQSLGVKGCSYSTLDRSSRLFNKAGLYPHTLTLREHILVLEAERG